MKSMVEKLKEETFAYEDIKSYVEENAYLGGMTVDEYINTMSNFELMDAYLTWNGIIGYTTRISRLTEVLSQPRPENETEA
jgi:hypothetical protein